MHPTPAAAIVAAFRRLDPAITVAEVGRRVGERHPAQWTRYVAGTTHPSAERVRGWCEIAGLSLMLTAEGWASIRDTTRSPYRFFATSLEEYRAERARLRDAPQPYTAPSAVLSVDQFIALLERLR